MRTISNVQNKQTAKAGVSSINWKKPLLILLAILLGVPIIAMIYKQVIKQLQKVKEVEADVEKKAKYIENQNPIKANSKRDKITKRKDIQDASTKIAHHLGIKYSETPKWYAFLDPRGWTENDSAVEQILRKQRLNYPLLQKLYYEVDTNSCNLKDDLLRLLDDDTLAKVSKYLKL